MSLFFNQMLGCLLIAAGIGGVVGWLLKHVSAGKLAQQLADVTAMMRLKEQMLEKARHQLRDAASASKTQLRENEMMASETISHFSQEDLTSQARSVGSEHHGNHTDSLHARLQESEAAGGWIEWLDIQLAQRDEKHRVALDEVMLQLAERDQRIREFEQIQKRAEALEAFPTDKAA